MASGMNKFLKNDNHLELVCTINRKVTTQREMIRSLSIDGPTEPSAILNHKNVTFGKNGIKTRKSPKKFPTINLDKRVPKFGPIQMRTAAGRGVNPGGVWGSVTPPLF